MRRETLEQIFADRQLKATDGVFSLQEGQLASLIIGKEGLTAIGAVIRLTLRSGYVLAETKKGTQTYVEYDLLRAISFESKEIADRHAGFF